MKKKNIIILLSLFIILLTVISACNVQTPAPSDTQAPSATEDSAKIKELENQIILLMQNQQLSDNERKKEIAALEEEIKKLKEEKKETSQIIQTEAPTETEAPKVFKYVIEGGKAVITSIDSDEEIIVIPATIDGYRVYSIGSEALRSALVKQVVISEGIEKLDWFAFRNCIALSSVTIPASVTSIGYGSFDNTARGLTIVCARDSFAHRYAQSYGLTYDIT